MRSSYRKEDVTLLLKDITGLVQPQPTEEREKLIQGGRHYCEMLPIEYVPTEQYMQAYAEALEIFAEPTAAAVAKLSDKIMEKRGKHTVLVSLARAGIPVGILLKRYLKFKYGADVPHYAISIIRGRGIDKNAMQYLLNRYAPQKLLFVDGWIGKGAIFHELQKEIVGYEGVSPDIAVLADPADVTGLCGTKEDILIPSSCLNCTVSGLISRTFLRSDIIGETDFHGAVYYGELERSDLSYHFIEAIERHFSKERLSGCNFTKDAWAGASDREDVNELAAASGIEGVKEGAAASGMEGVKEGAAASGMEEVKEGAAASGMEEVKELAAAFGVSDINFIKPGIGETTRVLLRRVPWKVLIDGKYKDDRALRHILRLAEEKGVAVGYHPLNHYKCCGIIKKIADV